MAKTAKPTKQEYGALAHAFALIRNEARTQMASQQYDSVRAGLPPDPSTLGVDQMVHRVSLRERADQGLELATLALIALTGDGKTRCLKPSDAHGLAYAAFAANVEANPDTALGIASNLCHFVHEVVKGRYDVAMVCLDEVQKGIATCVTYDPHATRCYGALGVLRNTTEHMKIQTERR